MKSPLLSVDGLTVEFPTRDGTARVLDNVSFDLFRGEILGIVGESGCGKSMTALAIMGLLPSPPGQVSGGHIWFEGKDLPALKDAQYRAIRGGRIGMIFQEPMTSLNPVYTVGDQIRESLITHERLSRKEANEKALDMLSAVGIPAPRKRLGEYPHQLSGGMRQRIVIAIALICEPDIVIADEPTTALDVSIQRQILDLLRELQAKTHTAIILITHDMGVVSEMAQRMVVMYAGWCVEQGETADVLANPAHPYTRGLMGCIPRIGDPDQTLRQPLPQIPGTVPALGELGSGCVFSPRCSWAVDKCADAPALEDVTSTHRVACWVAQGKA